MAQGGVLPSDHAGRQLELEAVKCTVGLRSKKKPGTWNIQAMQEAKVVRRIESNWSAMHLHAGNYLMLRVMIVDLPAAWLEHNPAICQVCRDARLSPEEGPPA